MAGKIKNIYQMFQSFSWGNLLEINEAKQFVKIRDTEEYLVKRENNFIVVSFFESNRDIRKIERREGYIQLYVHKGLNPLDFINFWNNDETNNYGYSFVRAYSIFTKIFVGVKTVKVSDEYKNNLSVIQSTLLVKPGRFVELTSEVQRINKRVQSSKNSLVIFLANQAKFEFLNKTTKRTTSTTRGDFEFLIHRFNLTTKRKKKDCTQYLNIHDIQSLEKLFDLMVRQEVFSQNYLRRLDDYFIREKLETIIQIGKQLLELKSDSVNTQQAKKILDKHFSESIGQLETAWQKYFEKYLLYLFFSYKRIIPKVQLKNIENEEKRYPDFIGVNHYDGVDVIEIKTHLKNILTWDNNHKNFSFSSEMSKAVIQTINYMDAISDRNFQKKKDEKDLLEYLNIDDNLSRPQGIIIISSKDKICNNISKLSDDQKRRLQNDFTKLRNSIHNVQIFTFEEILQIAGKYVENFKST